MKVVTDIIDRVRLWSPKSKIALALVLGILVGGAIFTISRPTPEEQRLSRLEQAIRDNIGEDWTGSLYEPTKFDKDLDEAQRTADAGQISEALSKLEKLYKSTTNKDEQLKAAQVAQNICLTARKMTCIITQTKRIVAVVGESFSSYMALGYAYQQLGNNKESLKAYQAAQASPEAANLSEEEKADLAKRIKAVE